MKIFDDQANVIEIGKRLPIFGSTMIVACLIWKGYRNFLSSGKPSESVADRRLLSSNKKSGRDSRIKD